MSAGENGRQPLVLVVDDDPAIRGVLREIMAGEGYRVVDACSGEIAIAEVLMDEPSLILLDLQLPGMNGADFLRWYRARGGGVAKVILISGRMRPPPELANEEFIGKPFRVDDLVERARKAVRPT